MTPHAFIAKWRASELKERSASQEHFLDLCRLLGEPTPAEADPTGETYCFERGARKDTGGDGWADVWKRHHFAWEYKGQRADLDAAFGQLRQYALALENPPLLIVSDMVRFRIRTNWTNSVSRTHEFALDDLADAATRDRLKWAFADPERLRPGETRQALTERAAASFASVAQALRERGHDPPAVAHFVNRLVFCMFADDVGLLPDHMFTRMLRHAHPAPERFPELAGELFQVMASGGRVGFEAVAWFNGGLFDDGAALPLEKSDIETVLAAADLDWSEIDPSILGTLFERGLDPGKRAQLGAHYTDREKILQLVEPVVVRPLLAEWERETSASSAGDCPRPPRRPQPSSVPGIPDPAAGVHGTRSGLRLGDSGAGRPETGSGSGPGRFTEVPYSTPPGSEPSSLAHPFPVVGWSRRLVSASPDGSGLWILWWADAFASTGRTISVLRACRGIRVPASARTSGATGRSGPRLLLVREGRQTARVRKGLKGWAVATNSIRGGWNLPALQSATDGHRIFEACRVTNPGSESTGRRVAELGKVVLILI